MSFPAKKLILLSHACIHMDAVVIGGNGKPQLATRNSHQHPKTKNKPCCSDNAQHRPLLLTK
jgi:hypothetical protein